MTAMLLSLLGDIHPVLRNLSGIPLIIFVIVIVLTGAFLLGYLVQGSRVGLQLWISVRRIRSLQKANKQVRPEEVGNVLRREPLKHLWDEYADTLHELKKAGSGTVSLIEVRATVPAEMFFTREVIVDSRLFDDFTRHLPGVLTGLGIIGTFAGLLEGLSKFDATSSATAVAGLKPLLDGVAHAFIASAIAIGSAMVVTFVSRFCLAVFYRLVEKLCHAIDSLYATGAGEEYLSRLVHASEKSEAHAAQLKQALVEDLTVLMTNLVERQIQAQEASTRALGMQVGDAIAGTLSGPLKQMSEVLETFRRGNTQAVSGMVETMLTGFMAKLEDTFGAQMRGINEQIDRSVAMITAVQQALQKLVEDIDRSNEQASRRMSDTLEDAMRQFAANQASLTEQMRQIIEDFRELVFDGQEKSKKTMDESVGKLLQQLSTAVEQMELIRKNAALQEQNRNDQLANRTQELVGGLSHQVDELLKAVQNQVAKTQQNIDAISSVTIRAIDGMNAGALNMSGAAKKFETAGEAVSGVFERSAEVTDQLAETASILQSTAAALRQGFEQYETMRRTVDNGITALKSLIENAKKEAGLSREMLDDLEGIVEKLEAASIKSLRYFEGVDNALEKAFKSFGHELDGLVKNFGRATDELLAVGVQHLNGVVQELERVLSRLKRV